MILRGYDKVYIEVILGYVEMVDVKFSLMKRDFVWIGLLVVLVGVGFVYAYGTSNPAVFGHSADEIEVDNEFCNKVTGHDCGYDADSSSASLCGADEFLDGDGDCWTVAEIISGVGGSLPACPCGICDTYKTEPECACSGCCGVVNYKCTSTGWVELSNTLTIGCCNP